MVPGSVQPPSARTQTVPAWRTLAPVGAYSGATLDAVLRNYRASAPQERAIAIIRSADKAKASALGTPACGYVFDLQAEAGSLRGLVFWLDLPPAPPRLRACLVVEDGAPNTARLSHMEVF